jgi:hypothetical protein
LNELDIHTNNITDIYPLVINDGLGKDDTIYLFGNPLNNDSLKDYIPELEDRDIEVN